MATNEHTKPSAEAEYKAKLARNAKYQAKSPKPTIEQLQSRGITDIAAAVKSHETTADAGKLVPTAWPEEVRGVPNLIFRSALFCVSNERPIFKKRTVTASFSGCEIIQFGTGFVQTDLDVLIELFNQVHTKQELELKFTSNAFLNLLDRLKGDSQHKQLENEIARLVGGYIEIRYKNISFAGTWLQNSLRDDITKQYTITFDPKIVALFSEGYTYIDHAQRKSLGRNNLAKWLHGFYCTHADAYSLKIQTLHKLCGSENDLASFKYRLKLALNKLIAVGSIKNWSILGDLVSVDVIPSKSQGKRNASDDFKKSIKKTSA